jgi:hypothetical protein
VIQGVPLAARAAHEDDGSYRLAIIDAGPMAPQRVRLARGQQRLDTLPQFIRDAPLTADVVVIVPHPCAS